MSQSRVSLACSSLRILRLSLLLIVWGLIQGLPGDALADSYEAAIIRAVAAKERALEVNDPAHWEEALRLFRAADAIRSTADTQYELGHAATQLRQQDLAVEAYEAALDFGLSGPAKERAEAYLREHGGELARIEVQGPPGARVHVSGLDRGTLPLRRPLVVYPGVVRLDVILPGGEQQSHRISPRVGEREVIDLGPTKALLPLPPVPEPSASQPAPSGAPTGSRPAVPAAVPSPQPQSPPRTAPWRSRVPGTVLVGIAPVLAGTSAVLIPTGKRKIQEARDALDITCADRPSPDRCDTSQFGMQTEAQRAVDRIATWRLIRASAYGGIGAAAVSLGIGTWLLVRASKPGPGSGTRPVTAMVSAEPGGVVVQVGGRF